MPDRTLPALLQARVRIAKLGASGRSVSVEADAEARAALAERLGIVSVDALSIELAVTPFRGGFRVAGRLAARVHQQCVVTLEPVAEQIDETVDRVFLPGTEPETGTDTFVDPEGEDEPDWFEGEYLDLTPLIVETIALALDPYPRAPGARLDESEVSRTDLEASPFAALKGLKENG